MLLLVKQVAMVLMADLDAVLVLVGGREFKRDWGIDISYKEKVRFVFLKQEKI